MYDILVERFYSEVLKYSEYIVLEYQILVASTRIPYSTAVPGIYGTVVLSTSDPRPATATRDLLGRLSDLRPYIYVHKYYRYIVRLYEYLGPVLT